MSFFSWSLLVLTWLTPVAVRDTYAPSANAVSAAGSLCLVDVCEVRVTELDGWPALVRVMTRLRRGAAAAALLVTVLRRVIVVDATCLSADVFSVIVVEASAASDVVYLREILCRDTERRTQQQQQQQQHEHSARASETFNNDSQLIRHWTS